MVACFNYLPPVGAPGVIDGLIVLPVSNHKYTSPWFGEVLISKKFSNGVILLKYKVGS